MARFAAITCPSEDYLYTIDGDFKKRFPHLGLLYLATCIQNLGHDAQIFDLWQKDLKWQTFIAKLDQFEPDVIGFSVATESYELSRDLSDRLKQRYPEVTIVWGGAFPTFAYDELLQNGCVDFIVRFEGEIVLSNLLKHLANPRTYPAESIPGLAYRRNGTVIVNPREKLIPDLDQLPFPNREFVPFEEYMIHNTLSTTRGCPGACTFCCAKAFWPQKVRFRSAENIFDEVMFLYNKYMTIEFAIADDTFTARPQRTIDFCRMIQDSGIPFLWACESRADVALPELLENMHKAGCREIQFGVESGCPDILAKLRKGVTVDQIRNAFRMAHEIGFYCTGSFILGHPWDTVETMKQTLDFILELKEKYSVVMFGASNTPFPGCYQYEHAAELGLKIHATRWGEFRLDNPMISAPGFTLDQLREIFFYCQELIRH
jgi:radical SAM superfamily enzyme YgiQ (UPF0313 family)